MNVLFSFSCHDGAYYSAVNTDFFNLNLEHHKDINDAIHFSIEQLKKELKDRVVRKKFGSMIEVIWGEIICEENFIEMVLMGMEPFCEEEVLYKDITIQPPFHIDVVLTVKVND